MTTKQTIAKQQNRDRIVTATRETKLGHSVVGEHKDRNHQGQPIHALLIQMEITLGANALRMQMTPINQILLMW